MLELEREKKHFNRDEGVSRKKMLFELENMSYGVPGKKLIENLCGNDYLLASSFSLMEFFSRFSAYAENMQIKLNAAGSNFKKWFDKNIIINEVKKFNKEADILDMAGFYIESGGNTSKIKEKIKTSGEYRILNYFWYPELTFDAFNSDIIILPEIYSGNFKYINILIKKKSRLFNDREIMLNSAESIPSLYISASLKNYFLIKNNENHQTVKLGWKNFTQVNRIFVYNKTDEGYMEIINFYKKNRILLNENAPYYNFLPIILDDNQKNYLSRIKS